MPNRKPPSISSLLPADTLELLDDIWRPVATAFLKKWARADRVPYDEKTHRANLKRLGSPLVERIEQLEKQAA